MPNKLWVMISRLIFLKKGDFYGVPDWRFKRTRSIALFCSVYVPHISLMYKMKGLYELDAAEHAQEALYYDYHAYYTKIYPFCGQCGGFAYGTYFPGLKPIYKYIDKS